MTRALALLIAALFVGVLGGALVAATEPRLAPAKTQDRLIPSASPDPINTAPLPTVRVVGECRSA